MFAQQLDEHVRRRRPALGIFVHRFRDKRAQPAVQTLEIRLVVHGPVKHHIGPAVPMRPPAGARIGNHAAPGKDIRCRSDAVITPDLLRCHERRCPEHTCLGGRGRGVDSTCNPEVNDPRAERGQQHVRRLEITVHDAGIVNHDHRDRGHDRELVQLDVRKRTVPFDHGAERRTVHKFGDDIRLLGVGIDIQYRSGAERHNPLGVAGLPPEQFPKFGIVGDIGSDDLERDHQPLRIFRPVDDAHAAGTEPAKKNVGTDSFRVLREQPRRRHHDLPAGRTVHKLPAGRTTKDMDSGPTAAHDRLQHDSRRAADTHCPVIRILPSPTTSHIVCHHSDVNRPLRAPGNRGRGVAGPGHAPRRIAPRPSPRDARVPGPSVATHHLRWLPPPPRDARTPAPLLDPYPYCRSRLGQTRCGAAATPSLGYRRRVFRIANDDWSRYR